MKNQNCQWCGRKFKKMGIPMHEARCPDNPNSDNYIFEGPGSPSDLKKNSRKQTRPKADEKLVEKEFECGYCGATFSTKKFVLRHEKDFCPKNPASKKSLEARDGHLEHIKQHTKFAKLALGYAQRSKEDERDMRIRVIKTLVEELAHGEIIAVDQAKNRMIVSVPIEIPLQEIGMDTGDL